MTAPLLSVVYLSRNTIQRPLAELRWEIDQILETSQRNNALVGVTGALIFNRGIFGQVLEGPDDAVEETFERIQLDDRHSDVTVLATRRVTERAFGSWSMGYVGAESGGGLAFGSGGADFDLSRLDGDEMLGALHRLALENDITDRAA